MNLLIYQHLNISIYEYVKTILIQTAAVHRDRRLINNNLWQRATGPRSGRTTDFLHLALLRKVLRTILRPAASKPVQRLIFRGIPVRSLTEVDVPRYSSSSSIQSLVYESQMLIFRNIIFETWQRLIFRGTLRIAIIQCLLYKSLLYEFSF